MITLVSDPPSFNTTSAPAKGTLPVFSTRPLIMCDIPSFAMKLAPGNMSEELLLGGANMVPKKLLDSGYVFRYPELRPALRAMLG